MSVSNRGFGLMSAALALVVLAGCGGKSNPYGIWYVSGGEDEVSKAYTITTTVSPSDGGEVLFDPVQEQYDAGANVTATAKPNAGYEFFGWSGASTSKKSVVTVAMDGDKELIANFRKVGYFVLTTAVYPPDAGIVSRDVEQTSYPPGTSVTAVARPGTGYQFLKWSGATTSQINTVAIYMDRDKEIIAYFQKQ